MREGVDVAAAPMIRASKESIEQTGMQGACPEKIICHSPVSMVLSSSSIFALPKEEEFSPAGSSGSCPGGMPPWKCREVLDHNLYADSGLPVLFQDPDDLLVDMIDGRPAADRNKFQPEIMSFHNVYPRILTMYTNKPHNVYLSVEDQIYLSILVTTRPRNRRKDRHTLTKK
ncbi:MAG: hypothetical protein PWP08_630 [Methanofollis sp.]|nr:hypothetical protein [Methanofollis sp.]